MFKIPESVERATAKGVATHILSLRKQVDQGLMSKEEVREHLEAVTKNESPAFKQYVTEEINKRLAGGR